MVTGNSVRGHALCGGRPGYPAWSLLRGARGSLSVDRRTGAGHLDPPRLGGLVEGPERADAGYFIKPGDEGFLVRSLRTLKTSAALHISVVADPLARLPQLLLSDSLLRTHGRLAGRAGVV